MKSICVVTTVSKTMDWFLVENMKYLSEHGFVVTLSCDMDDAFIERNKYFAKLFPISLKRGVDPLGVFMSTYRLYKLFKKEKYDIVQYTTPSAAMCASVAGYFAKIPVRLYCQWGIRYVGFFGVKRFFFRFLEKITCTLSTHIEPDSFGNLHYCVEEKLYPKSKGAVVWNGSANGVNLLKFDISKKMQWRKEIRETFKLGVDLFVVGFVGRISADKGINELLTAYKKLKNEFSDIKLLIIGDSEEIDTLDQELLSWSQNEKGIIYCGKVSDVERYLAAIDVFVLPSYREGFGSVVIEAEAMGTPVIVTDISGPTEAMEKNRTGLVVERKSVDSLMNALRILYSDRTLLDDMRIHCRTFVEKKFDQKILFQKILKDRNGLIKSSSKANLIKK